MCFLRMQICIYGGYTIQNFTRQGRNLGSTFGGVCSYNVRQIGRGLCIARRKVQYYTWLFRTSNSFEMQFIRNTKSKSGNSLNFMLNIQITKYKMNAKLDFSLTIIFNFTVFAKKTIPLLRDIY